MACARRNCTWEMSRAGDASRDSRPRLFTDVCREIRALNSIDAQHPPEVIGQICSAHPSHPLPFTCVSRRCGRIRARRRQVPPMPAKDLALYVAGLVLRGVLSLFCDVSWFLLSRGVASGVIAWEVTSQAATERPPRPGAGSPRLEPPHMRISRLSQGCWPVPHPSSVPA